jgi:hypothetical protein
MDFDIISYSKVYLFTGRLYDTRIEWKYGYNHFSTKRSYQSDSIFN